MMKDIMVAFGTFSALGIFMTVWLSRIGESDEPWLAAVGWLIPSAVAGLAVVGAAFAVFRPAVAILGDILL